MSEDDKQEISYNSRLEQLIAEDSEKANGLSILHRKSEEKTSFKNNIITIPVIILSTLVGFLSSTSTSLFTNQQVASIGIGALSLSAGIISTVGNYFAFAKKTEGHRIASSSYRKLSRQLEIELSLPKAERIAAKDLLKITRETVERLSETSPPIEPAAILEYQKKFQDIKDISHPPETNGLHKVRINSHTYPTPSSTPFNLASSSNLLVPPLAVAEAPAAPSDSPA